MNSRHLHFYEWMLPSELGGEKKLALEMGETISRWNPEEPRMEDILTSVSEACLNAVEHGNRFDINKQVNVTLEINEADYVIRVCDQGQGFYYKPAEVRIHDKLNEDNPRGWGLFLIQSLADQVQFKRKNGRFCMELLYNKATERGEDRAAQ